MELAFAEPIKPSTPKGTTAGSRPRPAHLVSLKERTTVTTSSTQQWLEERLQKFRYTGIAICAPPTLTKPSGYQGVWHTIHSESTCELLSASGTDACLALMFCDPTDAEQMQSCMGFLNSMSSGISTLPIFLVAHTSRGVASAAPQLHTKLNEDYEDSFLGAISLALQNGIDDVILGEPKGAALSQAAHSKCTVNAKVMQRWDKIMDQHGAQVKKFATVKEMRQDALFDYLRIRLRVNLPEMNPDLKAEQGCEFDGCKVGELLGQGAYAQVFDLEHSCNYNRPRGEVLKVLRKDKVRSITGLIALDQHISMMSLVSQGSFRHPNIVRMYQVYHTPMHVCFRMENAGSTNLSQRLYQRESNIKSLSAVKVKAIICQATDALFCLHSRHCIAHRDIKPENIIISEDEEDVTIKLADFDMATMAGTDPEEPTEFVGTFPFTAPELVLSASVRLFPTDVWSMGQTLLEVACGWRCIERALQFGSSTGGKKEIMARMKTIHGFFERPQAVHKLLQKINVDPQLQEIHGAAGFVLQGMLQVDTNKRWTVCEMVQAMPLLNEGLPSSLMGNVGSLRKPQE